MKNDGKDKNGLLVNDESGTYFIPQDELIRYQLPSEVAAGVNEAVGGEVEGFAQRPEIRPVSFAFTGKFTPQVLAVQYSDADVVKA